MAGNGGNPAPGSHQPQGGGGAEGTGELGQDFLALAVQNIAHRARRQIRVQFHERLQVFGQQRTGALLKSHPVLPGLASGRSL